MSVLVIGATGFIGPRLIRKLNARGETVVGMDLNPGAAAFADVPIGAAVMRGDVTQYRDATHDASSVIELRSVNSAHDAPLRGLAAGDPSTPRSSARRRRQGPGP